MRALLVALFFAFAMSGCYETMPPDYEIISLSEAALYGYDVSPGNTTAVIFVVHQTSGAHVATEARSLDETIAKVVPTSVEHDVSVPGLHDTLGQVFIIYGVAPGEADIEVSRDGEDQGTVQVFVGDQDHS